MFANSSAMPLHGSPPTLAQPHVECLGIVGYHETAFVRAHLSDVNSPTLLDRIEDLPSRIGQGNNLAAALRLALDLLGRKDARYFRRIWLFTDGNTASAPAELLQVADQAAAAFVNINAVPVGHAYNDKLLESIVRRTHNGKYISPISFLQKTDVLASANYRRPSVSGNHRCEAAILCVDLSTNALGRFGNGRMIDTIVDMSRRLVDLKRRMHG